MNCKECLSIVEEYVENSLDRETFDQTAAHIFACQSCRTIYEELKNEQEIYSRYLLKIKEKPQSWDAVRTEIRKSATANAGTGRAEFYERFSGLFFRRPLFGAVAALVLIVGLGFGLWYRTYVQKDASSSGVASSQEPFSRPAKNDGASPDDPLTNDVKATSDESQILKNNDGSSQSLTAGSVRRVNQKKRAESIKVVANTMNESAVSFDSSEAAFNRLIEKCEMVLRSFRNAVSKTGDAGFDISYERRLAKELLNNSVKFRNAAQSQGNLPVETLLADLEPVLADITKLPKKATSFEANSIQGRIQESGIIAKLQIQSSIARNWD